MCSSEFSVSKATTALGRSESGLHRCFGRTVFLRPFGLFVNHREVAPSLSAWELSPGWNLRWVCGGRGDSERVSRGPGDRPVTLPREARQGGGRPPQWPGAASTPRTARRGSGGRRPARLSCNAGQGLGYSGSPVRAAFWSSGKSRGSHLQNLRKPRPQNAAAMSPRREPPEGRGRGAGRADGASPALPRPGAEVGSAASRDPTRPGPEALPGRALGQPTRRAAWTLGALPCPAGFLEVEPTGEEREVVKGNRLPEIIHLLAF